MPLQATSGAASYEAFGGGVAAVPNYIEDVFSTQVYTGTGATNNIVNGVDLATYGGLVWTKARTTTSAFTFAHALIDTLRGAGVQICSDRTDANYTQLNSLTSFNSDGYTLGADTGGQGRVNASIYGTNTYASWTFRKQPKFFDVVTYTGNGGTPQNISHSLGSVPGFIIVKPTSITGGWICYHRSLTASGFNPAPYNTINLNSTGSILEDTGAWNSTAPTSTVFTIGSSPDVNTNGATYVAYLFAHNAGGFGLTGTDNVISCGSYTGNGSTTGPIINLGYEPQWVMVKRTDDVGYWWIIDNMRGFTMGTDNILYPNFSNAEGVGLDFAEPTATGFQLRGNGGSVNDTGATYIYIAIRRGPMKVPTSGTSVFSPVAYSGTGATRTITAGFPVDLAIPKSRGATGNGAEWYSRLIGANRTMMSSGTFAEFAIANELTSFASNTGVELGNSSTSGGTNASGSTYVDWNFQRAPNFFDEVCYTGNGTAGRTITHNLTVAPELMIVKGRSNAGQWRVYSSALGATQAARLNSTDSFGSNPFAWNDTAPTASVFTVGDDTGVNENTYTYVAYLFATCAGVSKVFSYTGNGSSQTINCGFTAGARWILIKRTDSTGDWYVWDSARGIVSANDPHLSFNTTAAEVTTDDTIDTDSTGFVVNQVSATNVNVSSATYIGIAIA